MSNPRTLLLAAACTATGAGGALAVDAAGTFARGGHDGPQAGRHHARGPHGPMAGGGALLRRAVHAEAVVATRDGFADVTLDRGIAAADASGQQLTLTEGTPKHTYKTVTLTIPSDARVRVDGRRDATLADVKQGMRVAVAKLPRGTVVVARAPRADRRR